MEQKQKPIHVAAGIIVFGDHVFIAQRPEGGTLPGMWEFPGGKIEEGETREAALRRELSEELTGPVTVVRFLGTRVHEYDFATVQLDFFLCHGVPAGIKSKHHAASKWVKFSELHKYELAPADIPFANLIQEGKLL